MKQILITILVITFTSCSSTYWDNRRNDLTDTAHIHVDKTSGGITANISALSLGVYGVGDNMGGKGDRFKLGLGGLQKTKVDGNINGIGFPLEEYNARSKWKYGYTTPPYASIGFTTGAFFSLGVKADALEFVDFILGFFMLDIMSDDKRAIQVLYTSNTHNNYLQQRLNEYTKEIKIFDNYVQIQFTDGTYKKIYLNDSYHPEKKLYARKFDSSRITQSSLVYKITNITNSIATFEYTFENTIQINTRRNKKGTTKNSIDTGSFQLEKKQ